MLLIVCCNTGFELFFLSLTKRKYKLFDTKLYYGLKTHFGYYHLTMFHTSKFSSGIAKAGRKSFWIFFWNLLKVH